MRFTDWSEPHFCVYMRTRQNLWAVCGLSTQYRGIFCPQPTKMPKNIDAMRVCGHFTQLKSVGRFFAVILFRLLYSPTAKNMLANSEFLLMLSQALTDQQELVKMLRISKEQLSYISNAESGHGLIKVGGAKVPFINQFPRNTALYRLMTTKPGESL